MFPFSFTAAVRLVFAHGTFIRSERWQSEDRHAATRHLSFTRPARHERVVNANMNVDIKESSKGGQRHVNQTSKSRQRDINGTSKSRQQVINRPSTEELSRRDRRDIVFGGHKRFVRRGLAGQQTARRYLMGAGLY